MKGPSRLWSGAAWIIVGLLLGFFWFIFVRGAPYFRPGVLFSLSGFLFNSVYLLLLSFVLTGPLGLGLGLALHAGVWGRAGRWLLTGLETLGGLPSVAYGLFGLLFFGQLLGFGFSRLSGAFTLGLLNLPLWTDLVLEALKGLDPDWRLASLALGAGEGETIFRILLPGVRPGLGRAMLLLSARTFGESAAVILTAGVNAPSPPFSLDPRAAGGSLAVHLWYESAQGLPGGLGPDLAGAMALVLGLLLVEFLAGRKRRKGAPKRPWGNKRVRRSRPGNYGYTTGGRRP